jgi:hypothetical protein
MEIKFILIHSTLLNKIQFYFTQKALISFHVTSSMSVENISVSNSYACFRQSKVATFNEGSINCVKLLTPGSCVSICSICLTNYAIIYEYINI